VVAATFEESGLYSWPVGNLPEQKMDDSVTVKGSPVRSLQKYLEEHLTPVQRQTVLDALPSDFAARFSRPVLATETIPVHMLNRVTEEGARATGQTLQEFARQAGREAAGDAVKGIYRFFALVLTPPALLSKASSMWKSLYNRGDLRILDQTDHSARIRLLDFPSEPAGCARLEGWIEGMAALTGVKKIHVEKTKCYANGADCCEWNLEWT
jgi:hypothetical protein